MSRHSKKERERVEGDGSFDPRPEGFGQAGLGKWRPSGVTGSGSVAFDNLFRLGIGVILGCVASAYLYGEWPEVVRFRFGVITHPLFGGLTFGFTTAVVVGIVANFFLPKRPVKWLVAWGFFGTLGALTGVAAVLA